MIATHTTPLSCNSKEILHAGLPALLWRPLLFSLLSLTFPCLMELRQPLTDPALATNIPWTQAEQLLRPECNPRDLNATREAWARTLHVWCDRGTQPGLLRLARSRWVLLVQFVVHPGISSELLCTSRKAAPGGSDAGTSHSEAF